MDESPATALLCVIQSYTIVEQHHGFSSPGLQKSSTAVTVIVLFFSVVRFSSPVHQACSVDSRPAGVVGVKGFNSLEGDRTVFLSSCGFLSRGD